MLEAIDINFENNAPSQFECDGGSMYSRHDFFNMLDVVDWRVWENDYIIGVDQDKLPFDSGQNSVHCWLVLLSGHIQSR